MSVPQRWKLSLSRAHDLFVPEDYKAADGDVVPFQGLGLLVKQTREKNKRGIDVVTLHVQATEITLLGPADAERWVADANLPRLVAVAGR
jgi:hypothetical protein